MNNLTFDKTKKLLEDAAESDETSTGESLMWNRLGLISIQVLAFVAGVAFWISLTEFIQYGYLARLISILALPFAVICLLIPHLLRSLDDEEYADDV